jgi:hypothetical protein
MNRENPEGPIRAACIPEPSVAPGKYIIQEAKDMARSTEQVLQHHSEALTGGDSRALMEDYAADAVLLTVDGAHVGTAAIAGFFAKMRSVLPNAKLSLTGHRVHGDFALVAWKADSDVVTIPYGVDTFVIRDDKIRLQTVWSTVVPK